MGAYLPAAHEEVIDIVNAFILTDKVTPPPSHWLTYMQAFPRRDLFPTLPRLCRKRSMSAPCGPSKTRVGGTVARGRSGSSPWPTGRLTSRL